MGGAAEGFRDIEAWVCHPRAGHIPDQCSQHPGRPSPSAFTLPRGFC